MRFRVLLVLAFLLGLDACFHDSPTGPRCSTPLALRDSTTGKIIATVSYCR